MRRPGYERLGKLCGNCHSLLKVGGPTIWLGSSTVRRVEVLFLNLAPFPSQMPGTREPGGSGGNLPPNFEAVGAPPLPNFVVHFYFCLFLHVNLVISQKNSGPNPGSF